MLNRFDRGDVRGLYVMASKVPKWNEGEKYLELRAYVLNFNGRAHQPSVKNFQLVGQKNENKVHLQLGKVSKEIFNLDFEWPLSPFQAFGIAVSSFD
jgi:tubby-related protein 1